MRSLKIFFVLVVILAAVVSAYVAYDPYRPQEDEVFELNLRALAVGGGEGEDEGEGEGGEGGSSPYEYPDGYAYVHECGVKISNDWLSPRCKVIVVDCFGGGSGCNSRNCPVHSKSNNKGMK